jgi:hypothetical protein
MRESVGLETGTGGGGISGEVEVMGAKSGTYFAKLDGKSVVCFANKGDAAPVLTIDLAGKEVKCADKTVQVTSGTAGPRASGIAEILFFGSPEEAVRWTKQMIDAAGPAPEPVKKGGGKLGKLGKMKGAVHAVNANARLSQAGAAGGGGGGGAKRTAAADEKRQEIEHRLTRVIGKKAEEAHVDVFTFAADYLHCAFLGTETLWPEETSKKAFTSYNIQVSLQGTDAKWFLKSRWSHFEKLEKAVAKELSSSESDLPKLKKGARSEEHTSELQSQN